MKKAASYSFHLNTTVMKLIGLYPTDKYNKMYQIYSILLYIVAMMPSTILGILHFVLTEEITDINYNDFIIVGMICYSMKLLPFVKNGNRIKKCIQCFDHAKYATGAPEIVKNCVSECRRNSKVFFAGCIAGLSGFVAQAVFQKDRLPLNVWVPKSIYQRLKYYHILHFLLVFGAAYAVFACGTIDPLIGGLAHHATAQLKILKDKVQHLHKDEKICQFKNNGLIYEKIKKCIQQYQDIIDFIQEYEACFSPVVFSQFMGSGFTIGLCCFQISKMLVTDINFLISINYLGVLFFQIFFYCYYGTLLIEESNGLSNAIYMSQWYKYDKKSKQALMILMERSKKPIIVKAGKLLDLSLQTFTMILKRAYSLLAVLKNY